MKIAKVVIEVTVFQNKINVMKFLFSHILKQLLHINAVIQEFGW